MKEADQEQKQDANTLKMRRKKKKEGRKATVFLKTSDVFVTNTQRKDKSGWTAQKALNHDVCEKEDQFLSFYSNTECVPSEPLFFGHKVLISQTHLPHYYYCLQEHDLLGIVNRAYLDIKH